MHREGEEIHVDTDEARGGSTPHILRYVLAISLILAIGALTLIWITAAHDSDQPRPVGDISGQAPPRG